MFHTQSAFDDEGHGSRGMEFLSYLPALGKVAISAVAPKLALSAMSWLFAVTWSDIANDAGIELVGLLLASLVLLVFSLALVVISIATWRGEPLDD